jgi:DNA-binding LacI/PurR family transcriptional regulator
MVRATINDVARLAGVSKKTVSHFVSGAGSISPATREKLTVAIAELGYAPDEQARALGLRRGTARGDSGAADPAAGSSAAGARQATADATGWLLALGHRRIAFISGPDDQTAEHEQGYLDAMQIHGIELVMAGDMTLASGRDAAHVLLQLSPRPTAILAASDAMAAGVLQIALALGIAVPGALSVVGFGDSPLAECLSPPLTSVRIARFPAAGQLAVRASAGPAPV